MVAHFNIRYEFDTEAVHQAIAERLKHNGGDYICVADGVVLDIANRTPDYLSEVNGGMFSVCDSSYVPLYLKWIYGVNYKPYSGSKIFIDVVKSRKYRMAFLGASNDVLQGLKSELMKVNPDVQDMLFVELPFLPVDEFDYKSIASMIDADGADIVWVALGAPKQEAFMHRLKPYLQHGIMLGVGAVFKFYSGISVNRAPEWMVRNHLEFVHRIFKEPKKQIKRCSNIIFTLPKLLYKEYRKSKRSQ